MPTRTPLGTGNSQPASPAELRRRLLAELAEWRVDVGSPLDPVVEAAVLAVPRHLFIPDVPLEVAYEPHNAVVTRRARDGSALSSVSAVSVIAKMLTQLKVRPGDRVLEIGSGGYNAALLRELVGSEGRVISIDIDPEVVDRARRCLTIAGYTDVEVRCADGEYGAPDAVPFDRIIVTVQATDIPPASVVRAIADTAYEMGRLDVLVNNAGIAIDRQQTASSVDMERVRATLDANIMGVWRCCTAAIPEMRNKGYGRIVNVTTHMSTFAEMGTGSASYRVSKAGLNALTCVLAAELKDENILVNAASPGKAATRLSYGKADRTPDEAADDFVWLATLPDDGPTGGLFHKRQQLPW